MIAIRFFGMMLISFSTLHSFANGWQYDPSTIAEYRGRNGLPEFFKKIHKKNQQMRVAYLGGSITAANGWRVKTLAWLNKQYPRTSFREINAAISGTGSGFGACRLSADLLAYKPDLVFVEFRANGGEEVERQSVEGIIRQIRRANLKTDICFVYTITEPMLADVKAGHNTGFGKLMEEVANYYGLPSIDFAPEVLKRESEGTLVFKTDSAKQGVLPFTKDGSHPGDAGHELYTSIIIRSLLKMEKETTISHHSTNRMKQPLFNNPWEQGSLLPASLAVKTTGWVTVNAHKDSVYTRDSVRTAGMLRGAYKCTQPGQNVEVHWEGTSFGINDLTHNKPVVIEVSIDGGPPKEYTRPQNNPRNLHARMKFFPEVQNGKHVAKITVKELPEGDTYYIGQFMQASPLK